MKFGISIINQFLPEEPTTVRIREAMEQVRAAGSQPYLAGKYQAYAQWGQEAPL